MDNSSSVTDSPVNDLTDILRQIDSSSTMSTDKGGGRGYSSRILFVLNKSSSVFDIFSLPVTGKTVVIINSVHIKNPNIFLFMFFTFPQILKFIKNKYNTKI